MPRPEEIEGYEVPLHVALTQPILMGGAPRTFAILNGTLALVIGMGLHLWWLGFPAGAASARGGGADEQARPALV